MTIRVSPSVRDPYVQLGGGADLPVGAVVAAFHRNVRQAQPGPVFVMEKQERGWRYLAFDARGFAAEHGVLNLCERCHRESPSGALFGLPRGMNPSP